MMFTAQLDCTGCKHRPSLAAAETGDAFCAKLAAQPQHGNCLSHSRYDQAIANGLKMREESSKHENPRLEHVAHLLKSNDETRTGTYIHIASVGNPAPEPVRL